MWNISVKDILACGQIIRIINRFSKKWRYKKIKKKSDDLFKTMKYIDIHVVDYALSKSPNIKFIRKALEYIGSDPEDDFFYENIFLNVLDDGIIDLMKQIINRVDISDFPASGLQLLASSNPKALDILKNGYKGEMAERDFVRTGITPEMIAGIYGLGNREILLDYTKKHPEDINTLLKSYRTLEPEEWILLIKKNSKCINMIYWNDLLYNLEEDGEDYRIKLFEKEIKKC
jgi:hypothetical protein